MSSPMSHPPPPPVPSFPPLPPHLQTFALAVLTDWNSLSSGIFMVHSLIPFSFLFKRPLSVKSFLISLHKSPSTITLCPLALLYYPPECLSSMWILRICLFSVSLGQHVSFRRLRTLLVLFTDESPVPRAAQCPVHDMHSTVLFFFFFLR